MRKARAGSIQEAIQRCYESVGGVANVADDVGLCIATLSHATEVNEKRPGGLGVNYLDRLSRMHSGVASIIAEHFARLAGGRYVSDQISSEGMTVIDAICAISKESSEGELALLRMRDGGCANEARKELGDILVATERAIRMIDSGKTTPLREVSR